MKTITINGQLRTESGKKATRLLRSQNLVPAVIYGGEKEISFSAATAQFKNLVYSSEFQIAEITIDGATYRCILKDLQFHKVTDALIHLDFLELVDKKQIIATLPLKFSGTPIGVKNGGKLVIKMKSVKVKTYPRFLVEQIEVDITKLKLNHNIRISDIVIDDIEIMNSPRIPIASVTMTRQLKQDEASGVKVDEGDEESTEASTEAAAEA